MKTEITEIDEKAVRCVASDVATLRMAGIDPASVVPIVGYVRDGAVRVHGIALEAPGLPEGLRVLIVKVGGEWRASARRSRPQKEKTGKNRKGIDDS